MTLLYYDDLFLEHDTGTHPECAERLRQVMRHLEHTDLLARCRQPEWQAATQEQIALVHDPSYGAHLQSYAENGGGMIEQDTVMSRQSHAAATRASGALCDAVRRVVGGEDQSALCLVRPPGHHALRNAPMGFCLFNHIAVGAALAVQELELDRVLILDWDVHHGNGTQDTFWTEPRVGFLSIHRWPFYPGTGNSDESGGGPGAGTTLNLPVEFGTSRADYLSRFRSEFENFAERIRPQLLLISAGFDAHVQDPIGSLGLEVEDFTELTKLALEVAKVHAGGRVVSTLEGGYHPQVLAECVEAHLAQLLGDPGES